MCADIGLSVGSRLPSAVALRVHVALPAGVAQYGCVCVRGVLLPPPHAIAGSIGIALSVCGWLAGSSVRRSGVSLRIRLAPCVRLALRGGLDLPARWSVRELGPLSIGMAVCLGVAVSFGRWLPGGIAERFSMWLRIRVAPRVRRSWGGSA